MIDVRYLMRGLRNIDLLNFKKSISVSCKSIPESSFRQVSNIISHAAEIEVFNSHFNMIEMKESDILPLKRIVFTRIAAELLAECVSKPACIAETCHVCNLDHRVLIALYQRKTLVDTIFFQISGNCLACHFLNRRQQTSLDR